MLDLKMIAAFGVVFAGIGKLADFYMGKANQERVRGWLEENWYRFSDLRPLMLGPAEAAAYNRLSDRIVGRRLLSFARFKLMAVACVVAYLLSYISTSIQRPVGGPPVYWVWHLDKHAGIYVGSLAAACGFAISLSISRQLSGLFARAKVESAFANVAVILLIFLSITLLLSCGRFVALEIQNLLTFWAAWGFREGFRLFMVDQEWIRAPMKEIAVDLILPNVKVIKEHLLGVYDPDFPPSIFQAAMGMLTAWGGALRFLVFGIFFASIALEWLRRFVLFTILRLVEDKHPVCTVLFAAVATICSTVVEIAKST